MAVTSPLIVVTGASSGIGAAVAKLLAEERATVVRVDRTARQGNGTVDSSVRLG